jgi:hypothetical protein
MSLAGIITNCEELRVEIDGFVADNFGSRSLFASKAVPSVVQVHPCQPTQPPTHPSR